MPAERPPPAGADAALDEGLASLAARAGALADGLVAALPGWVVAGVERIYRAWNGPPPAALEAAAARAGAAAGDEVGPRLRALLGADIDRQSSTPLAVVRAAVVYPTAVLAGAGVPPVVRDAEAVALFPDDRYGLTPASYEEVGAGLGQLGLEWGAAKAWVHLRRRPAAADGRPAAPGGRP